MENSMHYGEIGEMAGRPGGGGSGNGEFNAFWRNRRNALADQGGDQELENSMHYGEIGEIK